MRKEKKICLSIRSGKPLCITFMAATITQTSTGNNIALRKEMRPVFVSMSKPWLNYFYLLGLHQCYGQTDKSFKELQSTFSLKRAFISSRCFLKS